MNTSQTFALHFYLCMTVNKAFQRVLTHMYTGCELKVRVPVYIFSMSSLALLHATAHALLRMILLAYYC